MRPKKSIPAKYKALIKENTNLIERLSDLEDRVKVLEHKYNTVVNSLQRMSIKLTERQTKLSNNN